MKRSDLDEIEDYLLRRVVWSLTIEKGDIYQTMETRILLAGSDMEQAAEAME